MSYLHTLAGAVALAVAPLAFAAGPLPNFDESRLFRGLIEGLGARDSDSRLKAERKLEATGLRAIPYLRKAVAHRDPEVRNRVLRLLPVLEHAALVAPKRYTLRVDGKPLSGVLESLRKATGYTFVNHARLIALPGKAEPKYTFDFKDASLWEMLDQVCSQARVRVRSGYGDDSIRIHSADGPSRHTGTAGSFRYEANSLQLFRGVDLAAAPDDASGGRTETMTLNLSLYAEPRLPFLSNGPPSVDQAYDDARHSMLPPPEDPTKGPGTSTPSSGGHKQLVLNVAVPLSRGSRKAKSLKVIKGSVPVTVLVGQKELIISDDVLKAAKLKKKIEGMEFEVHEVKKMPNDQYQVRLTLTNKGNPTDFSWMNTVYQRLALVDEKGEKYQHQGASWGGGAGVATITITMTFGHFGGKIGPPKKFTYQHWMTTVHNVPFEFRDVRLP